MISTGKYFDRRIFFLIITIEALFYYNFYCREIARFPPNNFDQTSYLIQAYRLQERILANGLGELWHALWGNQHNNGWAFPIEGALSGLVFGGARLPQLCVLFIAFCVLQAVALATARAAWEGRAYGYMLLGLLLAQNTLWFWAGGLFDFRMDFLAYSLYGIWACAVIRSKLFLDRRWAIGCGLLAAILVLNRFISVIYVVGVSAGFAGVCIIFQFLRRGDADFAHRMRQRLISLGLSLGVLIVITGPILLINRKAIYDYYVVAHLMYEKDIRAREFGIVGLSGHLLYYPRSILKDHLGSIFLLGSAIAIGCGLVTHLLYRKHALRKEPKSLHDETFVLQIVFLVGAILGPIVVLTADSSKSPVVGGIVGVPAALLIVALAAAVTPKFRQHEPSLTSKFIVACSFVILALGLFNQFAHASRHLPEYAQRRDLERIVELEKWLVEYSIENGWQNPSISFDVISGLLNTGTITTGGYEQSHQLIEFRTMLSNGIMGVERPEALSMLANSDFVILTTIPKTGVYPFYEHISQYWNDLKAWADNHMIVAQTVPLDSFTATVYVRPTAKVSGISGGWVTRGGLTIEARRDALQRFPVIRFSGAATYSWLPKVPTASAMIETDAGAQAVPASLRRNDNSYEILIDLSKAQLPLSDPVRIRLNFDTFFVPKKIGMNDDTRELVVNAPTLVQLIPR